MKKTCIDPEVRPFLDTLTERLTRAGFKQLTEEAATKMRPGYVVMFYNIPNNTSAIYIIGAITASSISFRHEKEPAKDPCVTAPDLEATCHGYVGFRMTSSLYKDYMYMVLAAKPIIGEELVKNANFLPLSDAAPTDIPLGSFVLLRDQSGTITPVITRVLSRHIENDHRFLFWKQSPHVNGEWQSGVLMHHCTPLSNYDYLILC